MTKAEIEAKLEAAKTDLAFALAQGDGYAEDAAAALVKTLEDFLAQAQDDEARNAAPFVRDPESWQAVAAAGRKYA
jgi:CRISPR/Cas system CSM-associated protein Csm2 small subunit